MNFCLMYSFLVLSIKRWVFSRNNFTGRNWYFEWNIAYSSNKMRFLIWCGTQRYNENRKLWNCLLSSSELHEVCKWTLTMLVVIHVRLFYVLCINLKNLGCYILEVWISMKILNFEQPEIFFLFVIYKKAEHIWLPT